MNFNSSDAWLLEAIKHAEQKNKGASLLKVVATADYINHSIMTFQEFDTGMKKLLAVELIVEKEKQLKTATKFRRWWSSTYGAKRVDLIKAMADIESYLNKKYASLEGPQTENPFTQKDFDDVISEYLRPK